MKRIILVLTLLIYSFLTVSSLHAQWSTDPAVNTPVVTAANEQSSMQMVSDDNGGAIVTWEDYRAGDSLIYADIYAQRMNALGEPIWDSDGLVICNVPYSQRHPIVASDGNGGAIIVWEDGRNGGSMLYAQRVNASGVPQWATNGIRVTLDSALQLRPVIISDENGGAIIAWHRFDGGYDIYAQRVNATGVVQWTDRGIGVCTKESDQLEPRVAGDGANGAFIAWLDGPGDSTRSVFAQHLNSAGGLEWVKDGIALATNLDDLIELKVNSDNDGSAFILWDNYPNIYVQKIDGSGTLQWNSNGVGAGYGASPAMMTDKTGGVYTCWRSPSYDIYAARISASGTQLWATPICSVDVVSQDFPAMTSAQNGGAIITWGDWRDTLYAQAVDSSGTTQWTTNGAAISSERHAKSSPKIVTDGNEGAIVAWGDYRNESTTSDIYAQNVNRNNLLGISYTVKLLSPPNNAVNVLTSLSLSWEENTAAVDYRIEISLDASFATLAYIDSELVGTSFALDTFPAGTQFYWRVLPRFSDANGFWSNIWNFTTAPDEGNLFLVRERWNLISVPLDVPNYSKSVLYPTSVSDAFSYSTSGGYQTQATLTHGIGYWLKFSYAQFIPLDGDVINEDTIHVNAGWNMIGSISSAISVENVLSHPPGLITSQFFGYNNGYFESTTIEPGKGYWVKVSVDADLTFSITAANASNKIIIVPINELPPPPPGLSEHDLPLPTCYSLNQNFPNPFNPSTVIKYSVPSSQYVSLKIYNVLGEEVATLVDGMQDAGFKMQTFDASGLPSGVYYYQLMVVGEDGILSYTNTKKLLLLK
ncbi:MAG: T9SS type A sorting domain-containing protein [Bacteroidetes bacterium]|nr:MAG: T9SS type A sorting domain-containing protein [Bacteroidota bacterium]